MKRLGCRETTFFFWGDFCVIAHSLPTASYAKKKKNLLAQVNLDRQIFIFFAEEGGFEPPVQLPVRQFSKLLVSATHPPFRKL